MGVSGAPGRSSFINNKSPDMARGSRLTKQDTVQEASEDNSAKQTSDAGGDQIKIPQLVSLDLNLDSLRSFLEELQETITDHATSIKTLKADVLKKANEKTVGFYLAKVSEGLFKECGEKPHSIRIDNETSNFLQENFQTDDSTLLKRQAEKMLDKIEIIGQNIINFHKFRTETNERVERVEKLLPKCFTIDQFREES